MSAVVAKVAVDAGAPSLLLTTLLALAFGAGVVAVALGRAQKGWLDVPRLVLVTLGLLYLPEVSPRIGGDGYQCYVILRSAVLDGDLDFENDYAGLRAKPVISAQGEVTSRFPIGTALYWLPAFVAAHAASRVANAFGAGLPSDGFAPLYQSAATAATFAIGFAALLLLESALRRRYSPAIALLAVLSVWLATPLHFYMVANAFMTHGPSAALATFFVLAWLRARESAGARWWVVTGVLGGFMAIIRPQDGVFVLLPLLDLLFSFRARRARLAALYLAGPLAFGCLQLAVWLHFYGPDFATIISGQSYVGHSEPQVLELLFAARHGLLTWSPALLLAGLGLLLMAGRDLRLATLFCLGLALHVVLNSAMQDWWGSDSFGQRRMLGATPLLAFGFAEAIAFLLRRPVVLVAALLTALAFWNLQFESIYNSRVVARRGQAVSLDRLAAAQVQLVYRRLQRLEALLPRRVFFFVHDNLNGTWLDEGPFSLEGRVDLGAEPSALPTLVGAGWSEAVNETDGNFRRVLGQRAELRVPIRAPGDFRVLVRARAPASAPNAALVLEVNGQALAPAALSPEWSRLEFTVPARLLRPGFNDVALVPMQAPAEGARNAVAVDFLEWRRQEGARSGPR